MKVAAPATISGMTHSEISRYGKAEFNADGFDADRRAWGFGRPPHECSELSRWYSSDIKVATEVLEKYMMACEQAIDEETRELNSWKAEMARQAAEIEKREESRLAASQAEAEEFRRLQEAEENRKEELVSDRLERLQKTKAFPMLSDLPKKPIKFRNGHEANQTNVGLMMGCSEMGLSPSDVSYDRSGQALNVLFTEVESPFGTVPVTFKFIENSDFWLINKVQFGNQQLVSPGDLIPTMGGLMNRGDCLG